VANPKYSLFPQSSGIAYCSMRARNGCQTTWLPLSWRRTCGLVHVRCLGCDCGDNCLERSAAGAHKCRYRSALEPGIIRGETLPRPVRLRRHRLDGWCSGRFPRAIGTTWGGSAVCPWTLVPCHVSNMWCRAPSSRASQRRGPPVWLVTETFQCDPERSAARPGPRRVRLHSGLHHVRGSVRRTGLEGRRGSPAAGDSRSKGWRTSCLSVQRPTGHDYRCRCPPLRPKSQTAPR
jgi:hypothetical protein